MDYTKVSEVLKFSNRRFDEKKIKDDLNKYGFIICEIGYQATTIKNKAKYVHLDEFFDIALIDKLSDVSKAELANIDIDTLKLNVFSIYFIVPNEEKNKDKKSCKYISEKLNNFQIINFNPSTNDKVLFVTYEQGIDRVNMTYREDGNYFHIRCLDSIEQATRICNELKTLFEWNKDNSQNNDINGSIEL